MMLRVLLGACLSVVHTELDARCDKLSCRTLGHKGADVTRGVSVGGGGDDGRRTPRRRVRLFLI